MICQCPAAASLSAIPKYDCVENFGQIQKIAFQRLKDSSGDPVTNFDPTTTLITLKASWTAAMALTTDGKIVVSPFIEAPTQEGGDARTFGGGNDTLGGIEYVIGSSPSVFNCVIRRCPQNVIKALKELQCEAE